MPDDSLSPADKAIVAFFEIVAFALGWAGVDRLLAGTSMFVVIPIFAATILTSYTGFKWPSIKPKIQPSAATMLGRRSYRQIMSAFVILVVVASLAYRYLHRNASTDTTSSIQSASPSAASSDISDASHVGAHAVKVIDENGAPLKGAEIYFIRRNGVHSSKAISDDTGIAEVAAPGEVVSVFCALDGFSSYYQKDYNPSMPLKIRLKTSPRGGSVIFEDGTGYITGLSGRLNPILDTLGRTYLYAENIAVDGGKTQPVTFVLNHPLILEDASGHKVEIEIVAIIGSSSLIQYRRLVRSVERRTPPPMSPSGGITGSPAVGTPPMNATQDQTRAGAPPDTPPEDTVKAVDKANRMTRALTAVLAKKDTITFLVTWPKDDNSNLVFIEGLISQACRESPRQCWFTQEGNPQDLDKPPVQASGRPGITVHGADAYALARALGDWFVTHSTSTFPAELNGYNDYHTKEMMWIEIGPGSPWKPTTK